MTSNEILNPLLLASPAFCPACESPRRKRLGPVRYGVNATVADQDASELAARLGRIDLVECGACGFRWTDPQYSMDAVIDLYRQNEEEHWQAEGRSWEGRVDRLGPYLPRSGKALDVGCYTGGFLERLGGEWELHGIEPIPFAAQEARRRGVRIFQGALQDADYPPGAFDLITLWDVAEHLQRPFDAFSRVAQWLKPGGLIALETGNVDSSISRYMGSDWWYVALLEHCSFFAPESFRRLFRRLNLKEVSVQSVYHHRMGRKELAVQLAKAALYRTASRISESSGGAAAYPLIRWILRKHAPCAIVKDHLFVIARKPLE
jgi:SAM-dependent methyltransferase